MHLQVPLCRIFILNTGIFSYCKNFFLYSLAIILLNFKEIDPSANKLLFLNGLSKRSSRCYAQAGKFSSCVCDRFSKFLHRINKYHHRRHEHHSKRLFLAWQDFRTSPYFIMDTLLCFKKTIAITIDVLWDCGALFFLLRGFFQSVYGL